jgi:hypothetical protein
MTPARIKAGHKLVNGGDLQNAGLLVEEEVGLSSKNDGVSWSMNDAPKRFDETKAVAYMVDCATVCDCSAVSAEVTAK